MKKKFFSVYSTIGYGNMAADTVACRIATVIYGAIGIPLFFAFIKEEGAFFRLCFMRLYNFIKKYKFNRKSLINCEFYAK